MEVKPEESFKTDEMSFEKVLSFHMNRILLSDPFDYINNVEKFSDVLYPFFSDEDKTAWNVIDEEEKKIINTTNINKRYGLRHRSLDNIREGFARRKMRVLMGFINNKGWLIDRNVYGDSMPPIGDIDPVFWTWVRKRQLRITKYNQNWLCLVVGPTGGGKSYSAGTIADAMDPSFILSIIRDGIESRVAIGHSEKFLKILNSGKLRSGNVIIFDEAGVGIPSREWWDECNRLVDYVLQTFRHMNLGVIFTTPDMGYIDSHARKVFHDYLECLSINQHEQKVVIKPMQMQNNPQRETIYYKYPRYRGLPMKRMGIIKPPKEFIEVYEPLKVEFSKTLNIEAEETIRRRKTKDQRKKLMDEDLIAVGKAEGLNFNDVYKIMARFECGHHRARRIQAKLGTRKKDIRAKGNTKPLEKS